MNEYHCYEKICSMKNIAAQYTAGRNYEKKLQYMADDIANQTYRVAFIGEFKRGKSSLINALLGTDILPMDILPMTASVIRICHGAKRRILVHFKDGHDEEHTIKELADFATKDSDIRQKMASKVSEVEVTFPSTLGRNHIEILDTPGLNDDIATTKQTMSVIGRIDAAVVVISAKYPVSMTEQNLILELIREKNVRRIIFAVTFIDLLETDIGRTQVLDFIKNTKLSQMVLTEARSEFDDDPDLKQKAENILSAPCVFGVSALQARQGIEKDDLKLLNDSNLPVFKDELLTILMGSIEESVLAKTQDSLKTMLSVLPEWQDKEISMLSIKIAEYQKDHENQIASQLKKLKAIREKLIEWLHELDKYLSTKGLSVRHGFDRSCEKPLRKIFITRLSSIPIANNTHDLIASTLQESMNDSAEQMQRIGEMMENWMTQAMDSLADHLNKVRNKIGLNMNELNMRLNEYRSSHNFPRFCWTKNPVSIHVRTSDPSVKDKNLNPMDGMILVNMALDKSVADFSDGLSEYLAGWRLVLFHQLEADEANVRSGVNSSGEYGELKRKLNALPFLYQQHLESLKKMQRSFGKIGD